MIKDLLFESFGIVKKKESKNVNNNIINNNDNKKKIRVKEKDYAMSFPVSIVATIPRLRSIALDFYGIDISKSLQPIDLKTSSFVGYDYEKYCNNLSLRNEGFARKKTAKIRNSINSNNNSKNGIFLS